MKSDRLDHQRHKNLCKSESNLFWWKSLVGKILTQTLLINCCWINHVFLKFIS